MKKSTKKIVKVETGEGIRFRNCKGTFRMWSFADGKWIIGLEPDAYESELQITVWTERKAKKEGKK